MIVMIDYASPSVFESTKSKTTLGFAANARRPVRFHGRVVRHKFLLRVAMRALGEVIWSDDTWFSESEVLDPVITVHPDRLFFEAFSQDQSTYASLIVDPDVFETEGDVVTGTTNIDFTSWLWGALGEMRSSRDTEMRIGADGLEVETSGAGGRFEKKVDVPDTWVRGFLQVQAAMGMPGTRISVKPIDLLSAIRFLRYTKAKVSPRALRYEFEPGEDARLILEPWEHVVPLQDATHHYQEPKTTRVWGRRRLRLIEGLLPFADSVDVYLKGRALPSFYAVKLPGMTFLLGLTGWSGSGFTGTGGFDLLNKSASSHADDGEDELLKSSLEKLRRDHHVSVSELADEMEIEPTTASALLVRLCRQGRCMFDVEERRYRHRELFEVAADESVFFPPDLRTELAKKFIEQDKVTISSCECESTSKTRTLKTVQGPVTREIIYRDWRITGVVDAIQAVEVVVSDTGRIIFGCCECPFFQENLMSQGPCEHILALYWASEGQRTETATSKPATQNPPIVTRPARWEVDDGGSGEDNMELGEHE